MSARFIFNDISTGFVTQHSVSRDVNVHMDRRQGAHHHIHVAFMGEFNCFNDLCTADLPVNIIIRVHSTALMTSAQLTFR